jgi:hypothetical protein
MFPVLLPWGKFFGDEADPPKETCPSEDFNGRDNQ